MARKNSDTLTSSDGGKTWTTFNRKVAKNPRQTIKRDKDGTYYVLIRK